MSNYSPSHYTYAHPTVSADKAHAENVLYHHAASYASFELASPQRAEMEPVRKEPGIQD